MACKCIDSSVSSISTDSYDFDNNDDNIKARLEESKNIQQDLPPLSKQSNSKIVIDESENYDDEEGEEIKLATVKNKTHTHFYNSNN